MVSIMTLIKATKSPCDESLGVIRWGFESPLLQKLLFILLFISVIDLPLQPSERSEEDLGLDIVIASIKQERRLREASVKLSLDYKVPAEYRSFFDNWRYSYSPLILARIIEVESNWTESAIGSQNFNGSRDYGMAQLNSKYHDYFEESYWRSSEEFNIMNGHHSLYIAAEQLEMLYNRLGSEERAIMAYNIGIGSVLNGWRTVSGQRYLKKVKNIWNN